MIFSRITLFLLIINVLMGEIHVFNRSAGTESEIRSLSDSKKLYISAKDLARSLSSKLYENAERKNSCYILRERKLKFQEILVLL